MVGAGDVDGKVRRVAPTIEPNSQLGQVVISVTTNRRLLVNSFGRAQIVTGRSCNNVSVPLTAVLYGPAGTVVQVVRVGPAYQTEAFGRPEQSVDGCIAQRPGAWCLNVKTCRGAVQHIS